MVERAAPRFCAGTNRERDHHELVRLAEVEGFIQKKAYQLAMDDPMLAEDLAQEAREAVIRRLREDPDCPASHLVNKARDAICRCRRKGKSVDGLLDQRGRARPYDMVSFEKPIDHEAGPFEEPALLSEVLSDPAQPRRVTEDRACTNVLFDGLRKRLSAVENHALTLRLMDVSWREVRDRLGQSAGEMAKMRQSMAGTIQVIWSVSMPDRAGSVSIDK